MALKDTWKNLEDAIPGIENSGSDISVEPINEIANAVIDVENNKADKSSLEAISKKLDAKADVIDVYYKKTIDDKLDDKANASLSNVSNEDFKTKANQAGVGQPDLSDYVKKEEGKGLSSNDFTDELKDSVEDNTKARHTHNNKELLDNLKSELDIIPALEGYDITEDVIMHLLYEIDEETKTATITGYKGGSSQYSYHVVIPRRIKGYLVTSIGVRAFYFCHTITSVTIPNSVTSIGDYAFYSSMSLKSVTIPDSVTEIGYATFEHCESLTSVTIPDSVTSIGGWAFFGCDSLTSVTIGEGVTSIGEYAFYRCASLMNIIIPDSVTEIGDNAFKGCGKLSVKFEDTKDVDDYDPEEMPIIDISETAFEDTSVYLFVPNNSVAEASAEQKISTIQRKYYTDIIPEALSVLWADGAGYAYEAYCDENGNNIAETYATKYELQNYSKKIDISDEFYFDPDLIDGGIRYNFSLWDKMEMRVSAHNVGAPINFTIPNDLYPDEYISGLVFDSGETPPMLSYTENSKILNWVGTDCSITDGLSIFAPQANTHYDIVFYFNGTCFVGLVNGYKLASGNA